MPEEDDEPTMKPKTVDSPILPAESAPSPKQKSDNSSPQTTSAPLTRVGDQNELSSEGTLRAIEPKSDESKVDEFAIDKLGRDREMTEKEDDLNEIRNEEDERNQIKFASTGATNNREDSSMSSSSATSMSPPQTLGGSKQTHNQNRRQSQQSHTSSSSGRKHHHHHQQQQQHHHHQHNQHQHHAAPTNNSSSSDLAANQQQASVPISAEYLAQLIKDKNQLATLPSSVFLFHVPRLIDDEINKVRHSLFQLNDVVQIQEQLILPEPEGEFVALQEKIYVPIDQHPEYNFVGRLLGPRGMTAKQLEQETGCKIMIRGKGSSGRKHHHHHQQQQQHHHHQHNQHQHHAAPTNNSSSSDLAANQQQASVPISAEYLAQLIKDKNQLATLPSSVFLFHVPRLIDDEINKVRHSLFQLNDVVQIQEQLILPEPEGEFVALQEKIYVPIDQHPEYNFVGRLLGPRGMTAKQLEQETGCKIMIRGKGSMRDRKKEEQNRGKANWEHLNDELHVLITVEDTQNRAKLKLNRAIDEVRQLLVPVADGEDELKKRQLMELAIMNGTYRDCNYNEALNRMLTDVVYRQQADSSGQTAPQSGAHQHQMASSGQVGSALHQQQQQQQHGGQLARHFRSPSQTHYGEQQMNAGSTSMNSSSLSSGAPSTSSNTPTSTAASQLPGHHSHAHNPHHHHPQHPQMHHSHHLHHPQAGGPQPQNAAGLPPPPPPPPGQSLAGLHHLHHHHHPLHHQAHSHAHHHPSSAAAAAAAAAAATAALMGANPADTNAMLYAQQQYHEFQHYAAMVAVASAASQQHHQMALAPDYSHQGPPPPPLPTGSAHPLHPHAHHEHAAALAVAAAAAAAAANQSHLQYHRPPPPPQQQQQQMALEQGADNDDMSAYHQQEDQHQLGPNASPCEHHQQTNAANKNPSRQVPGAQIGKLAAPLNRRRLEVRAHPYDLPRRSPSAREQPLKKSD